MTNALLRWWRRLWRGPERPHQPAAPLGPTGSGGGETGDGDGSPRPPGRRHYDAPSPDDDPQREAHLGAVLQALADGPLRRTELRARVDAADWGDGRLDAVVDHGLATGVLRSDDDGATVRARYRD